MGSSLQLGHARGSSQSRWKRVLTDQYVPVCQKNVRGDECRECQGVESYEFVGDAASLVDAVFQKVKRLCIKPTYGESMLPLLLLMFVILLLLLISYSCSSCRQELQNAGCFPELGSSEQVRLHFYELELHGVTHFKTIFLTSYQSVRSRHIHGRSPCSCKTNTSKRERDTQVLLFDCAFIE